MTWAVTEHIHDPTRTICVVVVAMVNIHCYFSMRVKKSMPIQPVYQYGGSQYDTCHVPDTDTQAGKQADFYCQQRISENHSLFFG